MSEHRLFIYHQVDTATDFQFYYLALLQYSLCSWFFHENYSCVGDLISTFHFKASSGNFSTEIQDSERE